jgi:hypothetical protein
MKIFKTLKFANALLLLVTAFSACQKQESLFEFTEQPVPIPPPPARSDDLKNVQFTYNGTVLKTSMIAQRTFDPYVENPPSGRFCNGFEFTVRLDDNAYDFQKLQVRLPLNDKGEPLPGDYMIENNTVTEGGDINVVFTKSSSSTVFPSANYSREKDKFNFSLKMRLVTFNSATHEVAGFIDALSIEDKGDAAKKINLKDLGFTLVYDHFEIYLDDIFAFEGTSDGGSFWYTGSGNVNLFSCSSKAPFNMASGGFVITDFKGPGKYESEIIDDPDYGPVSAFKINEGTGMGTIGDFTSPAIIPAAVHEINVETFLENVLIKGTFSAPEAKLWGNNSGGYYPNTLIPGKPAYKLSGSFFQRQL